MELFESRKMLLLLLLLHFHHKVSCNQCAPCLCKCYHTYLTPCVNCLFTNFKTIPSFSANFTKTIRTLILFVNDIPTIGRDAFKNYTNLEYLDLRWNNIYNVSRESFSGLRKLKTLLLEKNQIQILHPLTFRKLDMMEELSLRNNRISNITENTFSGLVRLKNLDLRGNRFEVLQPHTFRPLQLLERLELSQNKISNIDENAFNGLTKLKKLDLGSNQMRGVDSRWFQGKEMLESLFLHDNKISNIAFSTFGGLWRLKSLNLSSNCMHSLDGNRFKDLVVLEELRLEKNIIFNVSKEAFAGLSNLKKLNISHNHIQILDRDELKPLQSLQKIDLRNNLISSIGRETFLRLENLKVLNLQHNNLRFIPQGFWAPILSHVNLHIDKNPFQCSCKLFNRIKQLHYLVKRLHPIPRHYVDRCKNITSICEEERNFALGMHADHNCFDSQTDDSSFASIYNVNDGDLDTNGKCKWKNVIECNFFVEIDLPGIIVVTDVIMNVEILGGEGANMTVEVGDKLSGKYKPCNDQTHTISTSTNISVLSSCIHKPIGRNAKVNLWLFGTPSKRSYDNHFCKDRIIIISEVIVKGYDESKYNIWSGWNDWGSCTGHCGNGQRERNRTCTSPTAVQCLIPDSKNQTRAWVHYDRETCNLPPCPNRQTLYQWIIGGVSGVFVLTMFGIVFWYRKFKMVTYFEGLRPNTNFEIDPNRTLQEQIEELPYDLHWEFPRYDVKFGTMIGEGNFGRVWYAMAKGIKNFNPRDRSDLSSRAKLAKLQDQRVDDYFTTLTEAWVLGDCDTTRHSDVAVKTLKECATHQHRLDLASELKLLIYMGPHPNIVNVLASCTIRGDIWVIMEFCDHGSVKEFLSDRRTKFSHSWSTQAGDMDTSLCFFDLLKICQQITSGLMFIHWWKVVHRDLSARNILIDGNFNVKIADFGLARSDGFVASVDDILPIKWSSLESLLRHEYTLKSDIWSIGVLFWEIFALGEMPYPGMTSREVIQQLKVGYRMDPPSYCPDGIWKIISECWSRDPEKRPSATELFQLLDELKVAVCSAPDGQYYGAAVEDGELGIVEGPSLEEILQKKENAGFEDEDAATPGYPAGHKKFMKHKEHGSGPSAISYEEYQKLETDIYRLENEVRSLKGAERGIQRIRNIITVPDLDDNYRMGEIKSILDNNFENGHGKGISDATVDIKTNPVSDIGKAVETTHL